MTDKSRAVSVILTWLKSENNTSKFYVHKNINLGLNALFA